MRERTGEEEKKKEIGGKLFYGSLYKRGFLRGVFEVDEWMNEIVKEQRGRKNTEC